MIELSVIIINYNTFHLTSKCIQSVYSFTTGITFEVILVDNASTECLPEIFLNQFPNLILVKNKENVGFSKGNNIGINHSSGNAVLLLNSDTELTGNSLLRAYENLMQKREDKVAVVTGKLIYPDGRIQPQCGRFPDVWLQLVELFRLQKFMRKKIREKLLLGGFFDHNSSVYPDWIWGTFFMFRRDLLQIFPNNKLPETYFMYVEDMEWCYLIRDAGFKIFFDSSFQIIHHFASSSAPFLGKKLNPMIEANYRDLLIRRKGRLLTQLYLSLVRINQFFSFRKSLK